MSNNISYNKKKAFLMQVKGALELEKMSTSWAMMEMNRAIDDGFDLTDFSMALVAMKNTGREYWSPHSLFTKTDYWVTRYKQLQEQKQQEQKEAEDAKYSW